MPGFANTMASPAINKQQPGPNYNVSLAPLSNPYAQPVNMYATNGMHNNGMYNNGMHNIAPTATPYFNPTAQPNGMNYYGGGAVPNNGMSVGYVNANYLNSMMNK